MKENILDTLKARGLVKQTVYEDDLYELLGRESVPFYVGFDPTAESLHVGHFLVLMAMSRMQKAGHKPIVLLGGGTGMVGDPSGRTDMRLLMTKDIIAHNVACFRKQMAKFLTYDGDNGAIFVDNAEWLLNLNYIDFLRDVGAHFSVNRMLTAECFKSRMQKGLSFLEFNYMLMQAYDFLVLYKKFGCKLECGGDDQWSNILAGADLMRRKEGVPAFAMTFALLTTSDGKKMGKTQNGAVWLDPNKTTPYEFYQYFRNIEDADVQNCLKFLTWVPLEEIAELTKHMDERMNIAKERLAYEVTKIVHSEADADEAQKLAKGAFQGGAEMPTAEVPSDIKKITDILVFLKLAPSKSDAKRLIEGGGIYIDKRKIDNFDAELTAEELAQGFVIHKGKKIHIKISVQ